MSQRRSTVRVPPEFVKLAEDIRVIVNLLNDYLRDGEVDVPGSRAEVEHAQEGDFADDQIADPVVHIQVRAHHNLVAAIDHLGGVAACMEAENVALATISLLRPIVVAAGVNYYVLDPSITLRERLRRGWNLELNSVREQLNGIDKNDLPTGWEDLALTRHRYLVWATDSAATGLPMADRTVRRPPRSSWPRECLPPSATATWARPSTGSRRRSSTRRRTPSRCSYRHSTSTTSKLRMPCRWASRSRT